ncbi:hypothetical protein T8K17_11695 [Thalassobaculum sp. OXR-137]|uniref:hypothetical protein n=1 Tax=Thalassobaculum sp. OXR-137 TaxID=3100173 RepID=UPI002AC8F22C|nr:hypothetical protein [Thalassobaculum sp. OXR-137]WPZ36796.1 hypothetical protein T8K17_11695 [Thalassobaculum sp. OXR-137]
MKPAAALLVLTIGASPAAAASLDGIWGVDRDGAADCTLVMVLRDGTYAKVLLDLGTTQGKRDSIAGTSTYTLTGDRIEIAPTLSFARPEPRQVLHWDPVGDVLLRVEPAPRLTYRRCPDRPLNPMTR